MNQVTITNATTYSTKGEMAYELTYSEGTKVRAVESKGDIIRKEAMTKGSDEWKMIGKPYVVEHSKKRDAEKIKAQVQEFIKG